MSDAAGKLVKLGLRGYEAKVYTALVGLGYGTAKQIHEASGVPRPRVYDILDSLMKNGFVVVRQGNPTVYKALEPRLVVSKLKDELVTAAETVIDDLEKLSLGVAEKELPIWHIQGEWSIRSRLETLIEGAEKELIMIWYEPRFLNGVSEKIGELSFKKPVICLFKDSHREYTERLGNAVIKEIDEVEFMKELLGVNVFDGQVNVGAVDYEMESLILVDGVESMIIYRVGKESRAITIKLPLITFMQRAFLVKMVNTSRSIPQ